MTQGVDTCCQPFGFLVALAALAVACAVQVSSRAANACLCLIDFTYVLPHTTGSNLGTSGTSMGATGGMGSLGITASQPSLLGGGTMSGLNLAGNSQPFQLQKPPLGKRKPQTNL